MAGIAPCLWFDGKAEEAARFYVSVFPNARIDTVSHYGEGMPLPAGTVLLVEFMLNGQRFQALNGTPAFPFSPAVSFSVPCADQAEVDHYWAALTADGGAPGQCGWLTDRFGVAWQVVPEALGRMEAEGRPEQVGRMMAALMRMSKLDVAALEAAFAG
jgi:predicted 3-demethylubiquinone-9 3-methyltransferase (glyoxalase superfamily)